MTPIPAPNEPVSRPCLICQKPTTFTNQIHYECRTCIYCGDHVEDNWVQKAIKDETDVRHPWCYDRHMKRQILERKIEKSPEILEKINEWTNIFTPNMEVGASTDQQRAAFETDAYFKKWIKDESLEEQYRRLQLLEAITVAWSMLIPRKQAKQAHDEHDVKRIRRQSAEDKTKQAAAAQEKREKVDPKERAYRRSVDSFIGMGMSKEDAETEVNRISGRKQ